MENPTHFELNRHILVWRENLGQSAAFAGEQLAELEAHLRDSIASLQSRGLSAAEAFMLATQRVGSDRVLQAEFAKVNRQVIWCQRILWMLVGLQLWSLINSFTTTLGRTGSTLFLGLWSRSQGDAASHAWLGGTVYATTQLLAFVASLVIGWWLVVHRWPELCQQAFRWSQRSRWFFCTGLLAVSLAGHIIFPGLSSMIIVKILPQAIYAQVMQSQLHYGYGVVFAGHAGLLLIATCWLAGRRLGINLESRVVSQQPIPAVNIPVLTGAIANRVAELKACGLSEAEALLVARHRATEEGAPALSQELQSHLAAGYERAFWMVLGLQLWRLIDPNLTMVANVAANFAMPAASQLLNPAQSRPVFDVALPVATYGMVQLVSFGASLVLGWWLTFRHGAQLAAWFNQLRQRGNWLAGVGVALTVLLAEIWLPLGAPVFNPLTGGTPAPHLLREYMSVTYLLNALAHSATLLVLTFILARKQLKYAN